MTPHLAGSMGSECRRMGRTMVEELDRFLAGEPLLFGIDRQKAATLA
jgi:phosphoglycerate dehydrogenase-like enzyme